MNMTSYVGGRDASRTIHAPRTPGISEYIMHHFSLGPSAPVLPDEDQEQLDALEVLLKQTWTVWGVSSLFGLESDSELKLKQYSKKLREELAQILPHEDVTYDAEFTIMDNLTYDPSETESPTIKVVVYSKTNGNNDTKKSIYTGIFLSWRTEVKESSCDNVKRLPLLLCRGTKSTMNAVHAIIGYMFDCIVVALPAREDELMWLVPVLLDSNVNRGKNDKGEVRLEYRIPGLPSSDNITVTFEASALLKIWNEICDNGGHEVEVILKRQDVSKFHEVIKTQMLEIAGLQLGMCALNKINLPSFTMVENRMKAFTSEAMNRFLLFFNERALYVLHTLDYDTTQTVISESYADG